jgi:hypothetical protein
LQTWIRLKAELVAELGINLGHDDLGLLRRWLHSISAEERRAASLISITIGLREAALGGLFVWRFQNGAPTFIFAGFVAAQRRQDNFTSPDVATIRTQHGEAVGQLYSARRLCFSSGQPPLRVSADDAGTFLQICLFSHPDCNDRVLALVLIRPR